MTDIIGVNNPYGIIQQAGKRRQRTHKKRRAIRKKTRRYRK